MIIYSDYTLFNITRILVLYVAGMLFKKYVKRLPDNLIPMILVFLATILTFIFQGYFDELTSWSMKLSNGPICGLAAIGLHQLISRTKMYFRTKKEMKKLRKKGIKSQRIM